MVVVTHSLEDVVAVIVQVDAIVCEVVGAEDVDEGDELSAVASGDGGGDHRVAGSFSVRAAARRVRLSDWCGPEHQ